MTRLSDIKAMEAAIGYEPITASFPGGKGGLTHMAAIDRDRIVQSILDAGFTRDTSPKPRIIQDRDEFMALSEHCTVRIDYVNKDGNERAWHIHRISGSGGAGAGNAELAGNWGEVWDSYRDPKYTLAARFTVLYNQEETK